MGVEICYTENSSEGHSCTLSQIIASQFTICGRVSQGVLFVFLEICANRPPEAAPAGGFSMCASLPAPSGTRSAERPWIHRSAEPFRLLRVSWEQKQRKHLLAKRNNFDMITKNQTGSDVSRYVRSLYYKRKIGNCARFWAGRSQIPSKRNKCLQKDFELLQIFSPSLSKLPSNSADNVKLPKVKKPDLAPLMDDDITRFLQAIKGHRFERLYLLALFSGMRESEIMGLQWDDVDLEAGTITVCRQLQKLRSSNEYLFLDETKNGKKRIASIAPSVVRVLKAQRAQQAEWKLAAGPAWNNEHNLVFTDQLGGHLKHNTVFYDFKDVMASIGKPSTRFHDLRHSYAVNALQAGDSIKAVQEQLGHYSTAFTMDVYAAVSDTMRKESQDRMEAFIKSFSDL